MIFTLREAVETDVHHLMDIDIKCFDNPWSQEQWAAAGKDAAVAVAAFYGTPIGSAVYAKGETENGKRFVTLHKIAVKPDFRHKGVGMMLLAAVEEYAREVDCECVFITIPESLCLPGPRSVSRWCNKVGFNAVAVTPEFFTTLGQKEDGYVFQITTRPK